MIWRLSGVAPIQYGSATLNIVFDGNSLVAGAGASTSAKYLPAQLATLPPINSRVGIANTAVGGYTIENLMNQAPTVVDPKYVNGAQNILCVWEGTNSICNNGETGTEAAALMAQYCAQRLAAHPDWKIVLLTTLPRFLSTGWPVVQANAELSQFNELIKANYRAMGAKAVVDVRASGIFQAPANATAAPANMAPYMYDQVHLVDSGYALIAQYVAAGLRRLPSR